MLRKAYLWLYVRVKGHYPRGTLVRFRPGIGLDGIYWKSPGDPMINSIGIVVGPDVKWNLNPRVRVMFPDGVKEMHFTNLRIINEAR